MIGITTTAIMMIVATTTMTAATATENTMTVMTETITTDGRVAVGYGKHIRKDFHRIASISQLARACRDETSTDLSNRKRTR